MPHRNGSSLSGLFIAWEFAKGRSGDNDSVDAGPPSALATTIAIGSEFLLITFYCASLTLHNSFEVSRSNRSAAFSVTVAVTVEIDDDATRAGYPVGLMVGIGGPKTRLRTSAGIVSGA